LTNQQQKSLQRWFKGVMTNFMPGMITCEEFEEFIADYFEDDLSRKQKIIFEMHLRMCRECRDYLAAYRRTMEISHAIYEPDNVSMPEDIPEDLIKAVLDARSD
jgi:predicted anti-sigma-YlaC factor YlaD